MKIDFSKYDDGLAPAIVQDYQTQKVLMLGFMNAEALQKTMEGGKVTFYSRSRKRLWTKGEESGNHLLVKEIMSDCDQDTLLIKAKPLGPVCHTGADTCWRKITTRFSVLFRRNYSAAPTGGAKIHMLRLFAKGISIAQVGEEAVEMVIEAKIPTTSFS
jgi:phosphoribosyl-ATP pyrophosphohydrolase/phosphoribosyl-AMP cyclohydrolase